MYSSTAWVRRLATSLFVCRVRTVHRNFVRTDEAVYLLQLDLGLVVRLVELRDLVVLLLPICAAPSAAYAFSFEIESAPPVSTKEKIAVAITVTPTKPRAVPLSTNRARLLESAVELERSTKVTIGSV